MKVYVELLAATEGVALCETDNKLGTGAAVYLVGVVGFYIKVIRLAERTRQVKVERVACCCGVARRKRKLNRAELPRSAKFV